MNEFTASLVIQWYEEVERQLFDVLSVISFIPQNYDVFSPRFSGLLSETCDVLDSLFREIAPECSPGKVSVGGIIKKKRDLNIEDYGWLYASKLNPSATRSLVFVSPPIYLYPFEDWGSAPLAGTPYPSPSWWKVYNTQKHSRLQDVEKATMKITVDALCGLHQTIVKTGFVA